MFLYTLTYETGNFASWEPINVHPTVAVAMNVLTELLDQYDGPPSLRKLAVVVVRNFERLRRYRTIRYHHIWLKIIWTYFVHLMLDLLKLKSIAIF